MTPKEARDKLVKEARRKALKLKLQKRTYRPSDKKPSDLTALDKELDLVFERNK